MLEGIICPNCGANINEMDLREKLACTHCKKDLKDRSYLDFLEYLMTNGIVENLDFFDTAVCIEPGVRGGTLSWRCVVWWIIWIWDGLADNYFMGIPKNA